MGNEVVSVFSQEPRLTQPAAHLGVCITRGAASNTNRRATSASSSRKESQSVSWSAEQISSSQTSAQATLWLQELCVAAVTHPCDFSVNTIAVRVLLKGRNHHAYRVIIVLPYVLLTFVAFRFRKSKEEKLKKCSFSEIKLN